MNRILKIVDTQIKNSTRLCNLDKNVTKILAKPQNQIMVNFPVKMSDDSTNIFTGYRVQHNNILGPYKGGLRFHPHVSLDEATALATWMTFKCSLQGIPYGGGKGGLEIDPADYNSQDLENISRGFARKIAPFIGSKVDIPAPDVNTNPMIMDWMVDEYNKSRGKHHSLGVFTGKSLDNFGSEGRTEATGRGVALSVLEWSKYHKVPLENKSFIIQGFGNVGYFTAKTLQSYGMKMLAMGDHTGYYHNNNGYDISQVLEYVDNKKSLEKIDATISKEDFFKIKTDVVVPAALELQIGEKEAMDLDCSLVVEGANGPIDDIADIILKQREIPVMPDIMANSGGVLVSYFEWLQNQNFEYLPEDVIYGKLEDKMSEVYTKVQDAVNQYNCTYREAAYIVAMKRIEKAYLARGY